jgi:hypothetical protein
MPTDTYEDGSPRYDHGHDPATGERWWAPSDEDTIPIDPVLALFMGRERFRSREGRERERWSFVTWLREGGRYRAHEVTGVTGMRGPRQAAWQRALSESPWCRLRLEEWGGRLAVGDVLAVSTLSAGRTDDLVVGADSRDLDLLAEAAHIYIDMLPEDS